MGRPIFCRWCDFQDVEVAGVFPKTCADCEKVGRWSRHPGGRLAERRKYKKEARPKFDLTALDRRMLRRLRIAAE